MQKRNIFKSYKLDLNNDKLMRKKWYMISGVTTVLIIFFAVILGIMQRFVNLSGIQYPAVNNARSLNQAMRIMAIVYFAIFFLPYLYFIAAFFSGINQIYRSFTLHMIIWLTIFVGILLMLTTCVLLIAGYSNLDSYNLIRNFQ
ncbi:MPN157 family protein [Mycoplasmoides gallisepticum]|uniref:MPN157 family protein n=1 Tax=Mycoplasmoides gallisepticum TaxID=2096 RepID=UPI00334B5B56